MKEEWKDGPESCTQTLYQGLGSRTAELEDVESQMRNLALGKAGGITDPVWRVTRVRL